MKLYEFEAKEILRKHGVEVPPGVVIAKGEDVRAKLDASGLEPPVVVKSQVLVAGRGKAGGIRLANSMEEAAKLVELLFEYPIKGLKPAYILVERAVKHDVELYASITLDRSERKPVILASKFGGMDIEQIAKERPESIVRRYVDLYAGLRAYEARAIARSLGLSGGALNSFAAMIQAMYEVFTSYDADLVETNPLTVLGDRVMALDARIIVDDNAAYKHPELAVERLEGGEVSIWESKGKKAGMAFVELEGSVGIIGNGAGLTMTSMDLVYEYGGAPANFLDIGGGASMERVKKALLLLLEYPKAKSVFINVFGGITRGDEVARGIVEAIKEHGGLNKKIFVRLSGTREEEGRKILEEAGIRVFSDPREAAMAAVMEGK
ncbi:MAG: ADP-forming succinate--CoA ligase subunit beta [Acidilobaceae archaeon]|nr:ADP-forming succinate--CoA ligase subunit beta [Acidilobaceae archaeon]MCX8165013.1 ADP-forming succinate--CoA ligase subunit beta [Acidilobaceae archaeon]MDW7974470.1 ADP-forming succinate--CoA ligase subunit beta [Sulfolobales archaeon]